MRCHECKHWKCPTEYGYRWLKDAVDEGYKPDELVCDELKYAVEIELDDLGSSLVNYVWTNKNFFCAEFAKNGEEEDED